MFVYQRATKPAWHSQSPIYDAAGIKRIIDKLEEKGLVERHKVSTIKNSVVVTEKGKELTPELIDLSYNVIKKALTGITTHQRDMVMKVLEKIQHNLISTN